MERRRAKQRIDRVKLDFFINKKCWRDQILASEAGLSIKTIERAGSGTPLSNDTINRIASALDTTPDQLILHPPPKGIFLSASGDDVEFDLNPESRSEIDLIVGIPIKEFKNIDRLSRLVDEIRNFIGAREVIYGRVKSKADSGTLVTLAMSKSDIIRLIASMMNGELMHYGVTGIDMLDDTWLVRVLLMMKIRNSPMDIDVEAWSDLINSHDEAVKIMNILQMWMKKLSCTQ